jgi:hypothetical protein
MAQAISIETLEKNTGKSWDQWLAYFSSIGADQLSHKEIAERVYSEGMAPSWWCQMVTVAYEQHIGRRNPGQDCTGEFAVSVGKTLDGTMDEVLARWLKLVDGKIEFSDVAVSRGPDTSSTDKWRYWRCGLADGSRVVVNIYQKSPDKVPISVQHEKIESSEQAEHWRAYWKDFIKTI